MHLVGIGESYINGLKSCTAFFPSFAEYLQTEYPYLKCVALDRFQALGFLNFEILAYT